MNQIVRKSVNKVAIDLSKIKNKKDKELKI